MLYRFSGLGMSIICTEKEDPTWFVELVTYQNGIVHVERIDSCEG